MLDILTSAVKSNHLISQNKTPISPSRLTMVTKMNTIGFYARFYIDALTIAFTPAAQTSRHSARLPAASVKSERADALLAKAA